MIVTIFGLTRLISGTDFQTSRPPSVDLILFSSFLVCGKGEGVEHLVVDLQILGILDSEHGAAVKTG